MAETSVQLIGRMALILETVGASGPSGATLSDVVRATGLGKTTVHRLLIALAEVGYVAHNAMSQLYTIGPGIVRLAGSARERDLAVIAAPHMRDLARVTQDTVFLSVRDGSEAVCVAREVGRFPIRTLTLDPGDRRPLGVGAGSAALFAAVDERELEALLADVAPMLSAYPGFDAAHLRSDRDATNRRGHSLNANGVVEGMSAVGVVVRDETGLPVGAISVAAITTRMKPARRKEIVAHLQNAATAIAGAYATQSAGNSAGSDSVTKVEAAA